MGYKILSAYQYDVKFRATDKYANTYGLSQLQLKVTIEEDAFNLQQIEKLPAKS